MTDMKSFIAAMPKAELHVHLEGTLEAEMKFVLAERNNVTLPYANVEEMKAGYIYHDLPSFLQVFYEGAKVLFTEQDFFDLCYAYLKKAASQKVLYSEMFFDPQQHTDRGVPIATVIDGLYRATQEAEVDFGIKSKLILCFVRELSAESALATIKSALPHAHKLIGLGLDSDENGNPPIKFAESFRIARDAGLHLTAHCDLDQPNTHEHIRQALEDIKVERIDHGANILQDEKLIAIAKDKGMYFTVCPFANEVCRPGDKQQILRSMLDLGLKATVNSDDPAYMLGYYINENFDIAQREAGLSAAEMIQLSRNAFNAAWISEDERAAYLGKLDAFASEWA